MQQLNNSSNSDESKKLSNIVRVRIGNSQRNANALSVDMYMRAFKKIRGNKLPKTAGDTVIVGETFEVSDESRERIQRATQRAPKKKAAGIDGAFAEALRLRPYIHTNVITKLWWACGRLGSATRLWHEVNLYPIYNQETEGWRTTTDLMCYYRTSERHLNMRWTGN